MTHPFDLCRNATPATPAPKTNTNRRVKRQSSRHSVNIFDAVNQAALPMMESLCARWLPDGKPQAREWIARNPTRSDKRAGSFKINLDTGKWADFATDARGGDAISLRAYLEGMSQIEAARILADELGVDT